MNHVGLTDEDRAIFRRRLSVAAQGRYHAADRTDAAAMRSCEAWAFTDYRRLDQAYTGLVVGVDIDEL